MKNLLIAMMVFVMLMGISAPVYAYEYDFESGSETLSDFGKATSNEDPVSADPMNQNIRRNKDAADLPPPYFYGSGEIPTDQSSLYHDNFPGTPTATGGGIAGSSSTAVDSRLPAINANQLDNLLAPTSTFSGSAYNTEPKYYNDGSIGTLYIEKLNKTIQVFEGESLENMKRGLAHFAETSAWDGNCAFAGHNRGAAAYFSFVKDLNVGDKITYTTLYGSRKYEVYNKVKINETDYSGLAWSAENILSLITCAADEPTLRVLVQAKEVL
ncbi:MAG: class D sortase [Clostridiales bacterium]|jgi:sortase A|nr:class D sortase [Clostridiales bacterium]